MDVVEGLSMFNKEESTECWKSKVHVKENPLSHLGQTTKPVDWEATEEPKNEETQKGVKARVYEVLIYSSTDSNNPSIRRERRGKTCEYYCMLLLYLKIF